MASSRVSALLAEPPQHPVAVATTWSLRLAISAAQGDLHEAASALDHLRQRLAQASTAILDLDILTACERAETELARHGSALAEEVRRLAEDQREGLGLGATPSVL